MDLGASFGSSSGSSRSSSTWYAVADTKKFSHSFVRGLIPIFGPLLSARSSVLTKSVLGGRLPEQSVAVAAPLRLAAPVRRHQSLMSGLDHPEAVSELRRENFLYWYQGGVGPRRRGRGLNVRVKGAPQRPRTVARRRPQQTRAVAPLTSGGAE